MAKPKPWEAPERGKDGRKVPPVSDKSIDRAWAQFTWLEEVDRFRKSWTSSEVVKKQEEIVVKEQEEIRERLRIIMEMAQRMAYPPVVIPDPVQPPVEEPVVEESWYERMKKSIEAEDGN